MRLPQRRKPEITAGILFGVGLGGFFDGIVLHQLLQWHHMLSDHGDHPVTTVAGLKFNVLWDGLFHTLTYIAVVAGLVMLWRAASQPHSRWSSRLFGGMMLVGFGLFNVVEGAINHQILGIHHVNETAPRDQWIWWDLGFLGWGAAMIIGGLALARTGQSEQDAAQWEPERVPAPD
jgi:uncharacterized membrane protein